MPRQAIVSWDGRFRLAVDPATNTRQINYGKSYIDNHGTIEGDVSVSNSSSEATTVDMIEGGRPKRRPVPPQPDDTARAPRQPDRELRQHRRQHLSVCRIAYADQRGRCGDRWQRLRRSAAHDPVLDQQRDNRSEYPDRGCSRARCASWRWRTMTTMTTRQVSPRRTAARSQISWLRIRITGSY